MRTSSFLYALWCLGMVGLFMLASANAWSPFADGRRGARGSSGGGVIFIGGPNHK
ncbi:hypothetical protein [Sphingomonas sp.]|uniref:hypothetical protein n=1 Tax=Sphingomonas sp. TaxID=28214 RepID=UPI002BB39BA3|nr:hypothetical protein [Sphingomonas sp.]HTG37963.1 hypothetical protein [Sphingomonas sp.]